MNKVYSPVIIVACVVSIHIGVVLDGGETKMVNGIELPSDIDYQKEMTAVTMQFQGYESQLYGIDRYEWAVGTSPRGEDVQPFMSAGIVLNKQEEPIGGGMLNPLIPTLHIEFLPIRLTQK